MATKKAKSASGRASKRAAAKKAVKRAAKTANKNKRSPGKKSNAPKRTLKKPAAPKKAAKNSPQSRDAARALAKKSGKAKSRGFQLTFPAFPEKAKVTVDVLDAGEEHIDTIKPDSNKTLDVPGNKGETRTFVLRVNGEEVERITLTA